MANAPLAFPRIFANQAQGWVQQTSAQSDGSNTFVAGQILKLSSGSLAPYVADDTAVWGLSLDVSHASTDTPDVAPFGELHNPAGLRSVRLLMNITDGSGTVGSGSTTQADVTIGTLYSARYLATVNTAILALDASDSGTATKNIFRVVGLYNTTLASDGDASGDFNGRVIVEVIGTAIQS